MDREPESGASALVLGAAVRSSKPAAPAKLTRVLLVASDGRVGGGTTHVLQLLEGLAPDRWKASLVCEGGSYLAARAAERGIEVVTLPFMRRRLQGGLLRALRRLVLNGGCDLVHAHGTRAAFSTALARVGGRAPPLIYTEHGLAVDVERPGVLRPFAHFAERYIAKSASRIIVLSEYARRRLGELCPGTGGKIEVIPNAVAPQRVSPARRLRLRRELGVPEGACLVGTVARMAPPKAPLDFVRAAHLVHRRDPTARFAVVGDGPLRAKAEREAARLGVPAIFTGEREDARVLLSAMDVFVLASRWEGMPISVLEAMAAGLPVVATDVGGVGSMVLPGRTGVLVPPRAPHLLAEAVLGLAADPSLRLRYGAEAQRQAESKYAPRTMIEALEKVYEEVSERSSVRGKAADPS